MAHYDFENPIYQAEEDCELPDELARLLRQEEKAIQPHQEILLDHFLYVLNCA